MNQPRRGLLIISQSARQLTASAVRGGYRVVAFDRFADADTRSLAELTEALPGDSEGFERDSLLAAVARHAPPENYGLVYGSGFDGNPDLLEELTNNRQYFGNSPQLLRLLKSPERFFPLLDRLDIPYPEIRFAPPSGDSVWLIKPSGSEGGKKIRFHNSGTMIEPGEYYQRYIRGEACSALFLAADHQSRMIGFNTLWAVGNETNPFLFGGCINQARLNSRQRLFVADYVARLVRATGLVGLNSLDFMVDDDGNCLVLELNPRLSATLGLYDMDFPGGLVAHHIRACQGQLECSVPVEGPVRAFAVAMALDDLTIQPSVNWPAWCADIPPAGQVIHAGQPLCTVLAEGTVREEVEALLSYRKKEILNLFR